MKCRHYYQHAFPRAHVLGLNIHPLHVNTQLRWLTTFDGELIIRDRRELNSPRLSWRRRWFFAAPNEKFLGACRASWANKTIPVFIYTSTPSADPHVKWLQNNTITTRPRVHPRWPALVLVLTPCDPALFSLPSDSRCSITAPLQGKRNEKRGTCDRGNRRIRSKGR